MHRRVSLIGLAIWCVFSCGATAVFAQEEEQERPLVWDIGRSVLLDPTTYAPALLAYEAQRMDWKTSQVFFERGWLEQNPRFTVSGRPNDIAVAYDEGLRRIRQNALLQLQWSVTNNVVVGICERVLIERYPGHRKLFRVLSWVERISMASYVAYLASADHFRQAHRNRELARQHGY